MYVCIYICKRPSPSILHQYTLHNVCKGVRGGVKGGEGVREGGGVKGGERGDFSVYYIYAHFVFLVHLRVLLRAVQPHHVRQGLPLPRLGGGHGVPHLTFFNDLGPR